MQEGDKIYRIDSGLSNAYTEFMQINQGSNDWKKDVNMVKFQKLIFKTLKKKKIGDITNFSGIYNGFSKSFLNLMAMNEIKSFIPYQIKIIPEGEFPEYYYLEIKCKKIKKLKEKKKDLINFGTNLFIDMKEWGGEDIFTIDETLTILCTEKVKKLVEKAKLKNFRFEELKKVE
ncbi:hypothetical protein J4477_03765 [Candidatus Pacearchaeota archaeon]|nr:hypothetical protein [Candidatus Pacearchaeota archaeon]